MKNTPCLTRIALLCALCAAVDAPAQTKPADDAPTTFTSVKQILDLVPKETLRQVTLPVKGEAARKSANQLLAQKALRKNATFKVRALNWEPWKNENNPDRIHVFVPQQFINTGATSLRLNLWVTVADDKDPGLLKSSKGQEMTLVGVIGEVEFRVNPWNPAAGLEFLVSLGHCKVEKR